MLADTIPATIALIGTGSVAWVRRRTWRQPCHRAITIAMTLMAVAFALTIPVQHYYLGSFLFRLTGITHIRELVGHILILCAIGFLIQGAACRVLPDREMDRFMKYRVEGPAALAAVGMLAAFMSSDSLYGDDDWADLMEVPAGIALRIYWIILSVILIYLLVVLIRLMLILRQDPRNHIVATLFVVGAGIGLITSPAWIVNAWNSTTPNEIAWAAETLMTLIWAVAALISARGRQSTGCLRHTIV